MARKSLVVIMKLSVAAVAFRWTLPIPSPKESDLSMPRCRWLLAVRIFKTKTKT